MEVNLVKSFSRIISRSELEHALAVAAFGRAWVEKLDINSKDPQVQRDFQLKRDVSFAASKGFLKRNHCYLLFDEMEQHRDDVISLREGVFLDAPRICRDLRELSANLPQEFPAQYAFAAGMEICDAFKDIKGNPLVISKIFSVPKKDDPDTRTVGLRDLILGYKTEQMKSLRFLTQDVSKTEIYVLFGPDEHGKDCFVSVTSRAMGRGKVDRVDSVAFTDVVKACFKGREATEEDFSYFGAGDFYKADNLKGLESLSARASLQP